LGAAGGGDDPEALAAALAAVLRLRWVPDVTKVTVLITVAALHGIGEEGDY
jgi:hypothetical protein